MYLCMLSEYNFRLKLILERVYLGNACASKILISCINLKREIISIQYKLIDMALIGSYDAKPANLFRKGAVDFIHDLRIVVVHEILENF